MLETRAKKEGKKPGTSELVPESQNKIEEATLISKLFEGLKEVKI